MKQLEASTVYYSGPDTMPGLRYLGTVDMGDKFVFGGITYGPHVVYMQFPKIKRPSKGWRRHIRRKKASK